MTQWSFVGQNDDDVDTIYRMAGLITPMALRVAGLTDLLRLDTARGRGDLAFVELAYSISTGQAAYPRRYGQDFWADLAEHPHLRESFDRQMTDRFREQIPQIVAGFDWSRFPTLVMWVVAKTACFVRLRKTLA